MTNSEKMLFALDNQDMVRADKYFKYALAQDESDVLLDLAEYLESLGFLSYARQIYEHLLADNSSLAINLARIAAEDGDMTQAFLYLETLSPSAPVYVEGLLVKADLYQMEGLTDVAREKLLEANDLLDSPIIKFGLAEVELELENYREAIQLYASLDQGVLLELTGVSTYQRIGLTYASLGKFEAAIEFYEKSIELAYDDETVFELATLLTAQGETQKAVIYFKQLDTINPDFEGYEYAYAQALRAENQLEQALKLAQQGLSKNEFDSQLLLLASQLAYELHDETKAENYLVKARSIAEDVEEVDLRLSNLYLKQARYQEILDLEEDKPDNVLTRWNLAKAARYLEMSDGAARYEDLMRDLSDNPEFLQDYLYLLQEIGERGVAQEVMRRYLDLVPDDVEMLEQYHAWLDEARDLF